MQVHNNMRQIPVLLIALCLAVTTLNLHAVDPIPEAEQAVQALKIINSFHGERPKNAPKKLHVVYFTPSDREPAAKYEQRLEAILEDIRAFYRDGMERRGFGLKTFTLPRDAQGKLIIHLVKGKEPESAFTTWPGKKTGSVDGGDKVKSECKPLLDAAGISLDHETVL